MIKMYIHSGSGNHGCEAILRATNKIIGKPLQLYSADPEDDYRYEIDKIMEICDDREGHLSKKSLSYFIAALQHKILHSDYLFNVAVHQNFVKAVRKGDICLSIGGDNYCYAGTERIAAVNKALHHKGAKTVLWGCSIDKDVLEKPELVEDMKRYDLITVRETLSQRYLADKGITSNVKLVSDPAFQLDRVDLPLPEHFTENNMVGINASPLILDRESNEGIAVENYIRLIRYIIDNTDMNILLIPHVVWESVDDRKVLKQFYEMFKDTGRVYLLGDYKCEELKGFIARCRFFVGARTHATIAAYSTGVPTLVLGYSTKAKGIAQDIFGSIEHYVIPVQSLQKETDLTKGFQWLVENEEEIKSHLKLVMPDYKKKACLAAEYIKELNT